MIHENSSSTHDTIRRSTPGWCRSGLSTFLRFRRGRRLISLSPVHPSVVIHGEETSTTWGMGGQVPVKIVNVGGRTLSSLSSSTKIVRSGKTPLLEVSSCIEEDLVLLIRTLLRSLPKIRYVGTPDVEVNHRNRCGEVFVFLSFVQSGEKSRNRN